MLSFFEKNIPSFDSAKSLILFVAIILIVIFLLSVTIKFIFRLIFDKIKFSISMAIATLVLSLFAKFLYDKPIIKDTNNKQINEIVSLAASSFSGTYSPKYPAIAYKFAPRQIGDGSAQASINGNKVLVDVSYLPYGNATLEYDLRTKEFKLIQPLEP